MIAVSLPLLIVCALIVSAVLMWLNMREGGVVAAAGATLVVCTAILIIQSLAFGATGLTRQGVQQWASFVLLPSAVVVGLSRLAILQSRPWSLLFLGPLTFVVAVAAVMITYNVLFTSAR